MDILAKAIRPVSVPRMDPRRIVIGTALLVWGRFILLTLAPFGWFVFLACLALRFVFFLDLAGWYQVWVALRPRRAGRPTEADAVLRAMRATWLGSLVALFVGIATLPVLFPEPGWNGPTWSVFVAYGVFLFVPSVYGPVFLCHAATFLLAARITRNLGSAIALLAGGIGLVGIAAGGLALQVAGPSAYGGLLLWALPGLSAPAYLLILLGWGSEARFLRGAAAVAAQDLQEATARAF